MATRPNQPDPDIAGVRRATRAPEAAMLATDIQADAEFTAIPSYCASCSAYKLEKVTVPNAVIMDELISPSSAEVTGEKLAKIVARDSRITAKTAAKPTPHPPSSKWGAVQVMQRAVDMRNQGLIPFSPFHPFIDQDGLRDRGIFAEWTLRYLTDLPEASRLDIEISPGGDEVEVLSTGIEDALDAVAAGLTGTLPAVEDTEGQEITAAAADDPLIDEVPTNRDELLKWVGTDRARAIAASEVEGLRTNGRRKTVDAVLIPLIGE